MGIFGSVERRLFERSNIHGCWEELCETDVSTTLDLQGSRVWTISLCLLVGSSPSTVSVPLAAGKNFYFLSYTSVWENTTLCRAFARRAFYTEFEMCCRPVTYSHRCHHPYVTHVKFMSLAFWLVTSIHYRGQAWRWKTNCRDNHTFSRGEKLTL